MRKHEVLGATTPCIFNLPVLWAIAKTAKLVIDFKPTGLYLGDMLGKHVSLANLLAFKGFKLELADDMELSCSLQIIF